jgi:hypothetical protein
MHMDQEDHSLKRESSGIIAARNDRNFHRSDGMFTVRIAMVGR